MDALDHIKKMCDDLEADDDAHICPVDEACCHDWEVCRAMGCQVYRQLMALVCPRCGVTLNRQAAKGHLCLDLVMMEM